MNFDRLGFVAERASLGDKREALLSILVPETPGSFISLYKLIYPRAVTEFSYKYSGESKAHIFLSFIVDKCENDLGCVLESVRDSGLDAIDVSGNELAKTHARFLVGGKTNVKLDYD